VARKPSAKQVARALEKRVGVEKLASRLDVTPRTVKRWLRDGVPKSRKEDVQKAWTRSERSRVSATRVWAERKVEESRSEIFKRHRLVDHSEEPITGLTPGGHTTLVALIREEDPAWQEFVRAAEEHGLDPRREWFSPKVNKPKGKKKPKKKKSRKPGVPKNRIGKKKYRKRKK
jgi:hypothetical protein